MPQKQNVVPSSVRADGSVRKERKIRPGYVQQELVPRYQPPSLRRQQQQQQKQEKVGNCENSKVTVCSTEKKSTQTVESAEHSTTERTNEPKTEKPSPAIVEKKRSVYVPPHLRKAKEVAANSGKGKSNDLKSRVARIDNGDDSGLAEALEHMSLGSSKQRQGTNETKRGNAAQ
ncbi:hypothetical protein LPJ73_000602 [Coemansia sp. RSA 2703]|nr:hypothetical protein LPJ73_000602 [Coemansia sp. RSA 2703]